DAPAWNVGSAVPCAARGGCRARMAAASRRQHRQCRRLLRQLDDGPLPCALQRQTLVSRLVGADRSCRWLVSPLGLAEPASVVDTRHRRPADGGGGPVAHALRAVPDRGGNCQDGALCSASLADRPVLIGLTRMPASPAPYGRASHGRL